MGTGIGLLMRKTYKCYLKYASWILFHLKGRNGRNTQILKELSDLHRGKRAFIICNGPSLSVEDLNKIHQNGDISFACNRIDKIFTQTQWRPTYYTVLDETYQYSLLDTMNVVPAAMKFFSKDSYITTCKVNSRTAFIDTIGSPSLLDSPRFSDDLLSGIYTIGTTTYSMIQIAVSMGVRQIFIIGCDNQYAKEIQKDGSITHNNKRSYFDGVSKKEQETAAAIWQMNIAYKYARKYADSHGIKIYNATRGGHLEEFERVKFDELF